MARQASFDLDEVTAAGLAVAAEGWHRVSVRAVAEHLGVSAMALYRVAADADELRRAIADAAAGPLRPAVDAVAGDLAGGLHAWAHLAYDHLTGFPGLASYLLGHWTELAGWLDVVEALLAAAAASGLTGAAAVATVNAVFAYVLARAQLRDTAAASARRELAPLTRDPARYPLVAANRDEFTVARTERHFAFGLDALVAGLRDGGRPRLPSRR